MSGNIQTQEEDRMATEGQLDELRLSVERSVNKLRGRLKFDVAEKWGRQSSSLDEFLEGLLLMPPPICYTKLISGTEMLVLDSMDDDQIIGRARRVFSEYLDPRFIDGLVETSSLPAEPTKASVHKIIRVGKLATFFNSLSPELNILRFSRAQIVQFCEKYRSKISNEGSGTFFLFKQGEGFSVARVADVVGYGKSLVLQVYELSYKGDWGGYENHQIVVQQLEPASP